MNKVQSKFHIYFSISSRIVLAIVGSYAVAIAIDLACLTLISNQVSAIYWGYIFSLIGCASTIILVFSTRSAWSAWIIISFTVALFYGIWQLGR